MDHGHLGGLVGLGGPGSVDPPLVGLGVHIPPFDNVLHEKAQV
jgi:hypothetical protein